jgi:hypothetical protein
MNTQQLLEELEKNRQKGKCLDGFPCVTYQGPHGNYCEFGLHDIDRPAYAPGICPLQFLLTHRHEKVKERIRQQVAEFELSLTQHPTEEKNQ